MKKSSGRIGHARVSRLPGFTAEKQSLEPRFRNCCTPRWCKLPPAPFRPSVLKRNHVPAALRFARLPPVSLSSLRCGIEPGCGLLKTDPYGSCNQNQTCSHSVRATFSYRGFEIPSFVVRKSAVTRELFSRAMWCFL